MADIRTLKLALLADTKQFVDGLDKADKETKNFSNKLGDALKVGATAFLALGAAAGAAALKIGVDSVKAAIEDEKAQRNLAKTLENVIGATKEQTAEVEKYITAQSLSLGVSDDKLRPAYARLIRSTKDTKEAQKGLNLAMDISSATGKDLDTVTSALGKAYDGNTASLGKLGLGIDTAILKTGDMDLITKTLGETFKGFAEQEANTLEGRFQRISIAINEAKESLGSALLPIIEKFAKFANDTLVPALQGIVDGLTGKKKSVVPAFLTFGEVTNDAEDAGYNLGVALRELGSGLGSLAGAFDSNTSDDSGFVRFINLLTRMVEGLDSLFSKLDAAQQKFRDFKQAFDDSLVGQFVNATGQFAPDAPASSKAKGLVGINTQKPSVVINNNFKGPVDQQGFARTLIKTQTTATKTTGIKPFIPGR
jgi:hypothetical protein